MNIENIKVIMKYKNLKLCGSDIEHSSFCYIIENEKIIAEEIDLHHGQIVFEELIKNEVLQDLDLYKINKRIEQLKMFIDDTKRTNPTISKIIDDILIEGKQYDPFENPAKLIKAKIPNSDYIVEFNTATNNILYRNIGDLPAYWEKCVNHKYLHEGYTPEQETEYDCD